MKKSISSFELHPSAGWTTTDERETKNRIFKVCKNCKKGIHYRTECYYIPSVSIDDMIYVCSILCGEVISATYKHKSKV